VTGSYNIKPTPFGQKYTLLNHIKSGGMAAVWLGKMPFGDMERLVAIKRILPHVAEDADFISMFIDEAKITVQLNHPNICKIYELGQDSDYYIAMEYVHGRDLRALFDWCNGTPLPIPVACYVMACCCDGLNYAHRRKDPQGKELHIVHRDVSLQNILVSFDGDVKIIDFGIARAANRSTQTAAGTLKGKFSYMSPEQISGPPEKVDRRSDIFGIGICLYELLTGKRLFSGRTDFSVLEKVRKADIALPTTLNKDIPPTLEKIVMKSLARDVEERYQYASEVGEDLWHFLYGLEETFDRRNLAEYLQVSFAQPYAEEKIYLQECLAVPVSSVPSDSYPKLTISTEEEVSLSEQAAQEEAPDIDSTLLVSTPAVLLGAASAPSPSLNPAQEEVVDELALTPTAFPALEETPHGRNRHPAVPGVVPSKPPELAQMPSASSVLARSKPPYERAVSKEAFPKEEREQPFTAMLRKYFWAWMACLVAFLVVAVVLLWPTSMGNVLVEVPEELAGRKVHLSMNGKEVLDKDGGPFQKWPRLLPAPSGKARISMSAEGYEPLVVEVVVPKGRQRYVRLGQVLQKQKPPPEEKVAPGP